MTAPPLSIGSTTWPGLAKVVEECGELLQAVGKIAAYPDGPHPDGTDVIKRLEDELADVLAAVSYAATANEGRLDVERIRQRASDKGLRFDRWHREERATITP